MPHNPKYNLAYQQLTGQTFKQQVDIFQGCGNTIGIYSDVGVLLYTLAMHSSVSRVFELGSGMSTCVLSQATQTHGKEFTATEPTGKWHAITCAAIQKLGYDSSCLVFTDNKPENYPVLSPIDLVWVDGELTHAPGQWKGRTQGLDYYKSQVQQSVVLFDDAENFGQPIQTWLAKVGRDPNCTVYNPTGRANRHVHISFPFKNHPLEAVVQSCMEIQNG